MPVENTRDNRESLLLMAACLHGMRPEDGIRANCWPVIRQALQWAGKYHEGMERTYDDEVVGDWYKTLIAMTRHEPEAERLVSGHGNLGSESSPAAHPLFTACEVTIPGFAEGGRLFAKDPEKRKALEAREQERQKRRAKFREVLPHLDQLKLVDQALNDNPRPEFILACNASGHRSLTQTADWLRSKGIDPDVFLSWLGHQGVKCDCYSMECLAAGCNAGIWLEDDDELSEEIRRLLFP